MIFVNRRKELETLNNSAQALKTNKKIPLAIIGLRRIGKTELILKFIQKSKQENILMPYLNLQGSVSSPQAFAQDLYIALLQEIAKDKKISFVPLGEKKEQIIHLSTLLGENIHHISLRFLNTLDGKDYSTMIQSAFKLPEILGNIYKKKIIFFLDEFQELEELNNYRFGDVFKIMRATVEKQPKVMYIISGSVISFMENLIQGPRKPFFNQFTELRLSYFTKEDSIVLIKKLLKRFSYPEEVLFHLFKYTSGHPFYITPICERLILESSNHHLNIPLTKYVIIKETLDKGGKINILFHYIFEESLKKAKRKGNLKSILLILAEKEGLNLTAISEKLKKPAGQVNNYIKSLLKTDLVFVKEKKYYFRDYLFRFWLAKTQLGKDIEIEKKTRFIEDLLNELREKYLRASTELGRIKEQEYKRKLEEKHGLKLEQYISSDGQIEFDILGKKEDIWYIFEIKYRNKPANYQNLKKFYSKVQKSEFKSKEKILFFISPTGFTDQAVKFAKEKGIQLSKRI